MQTWKTSVWPLEAHVLPESVCTQVFKCITFFFQVYYFYINSCILLLYKSKTIKTFALWKINSNNFQWWHFFQKQWRKGFCCRVLLWIRLNRTGEAQHPLESREKGSRRSQPPRLRPVRSGCELFTCFQHQPRTSLPQTVPIEHPLTSLTFCVSFYHECTWVVDAHWMVVDWVSGSVREKECEL